MSASTEQQQPPPTDLEAQIQRLSDHLSSLGASAEASALRNTLDSLSAAARRGSASPAPHTQLPRIKRRKPTPFSMREDLQSFSFSFKEYISGAQLSPNDAVITLGSFLEGAAATTYRTLRLGEDLASPLTVDGVLSHLAREFGGPHLVSATMSRLAL
eukprot:scaffold9.g3295.t1